MKRGFSLIAIVALTFAASAVAQQGDPVELTNPGFEDGLEGWSLKVDPLDPNAISVDTSVSHSGDASLRFAQTDARAYSNAVQIFPAEPATNYVVTGWVKADGVERSGIGINLFIGDRRGLGVGDAIPVDLREGTYDWTRVVIAFNSGQHDAISIIPYLHEASGTVWFDDLEAFEMATWGVEAPPAGRPGPPVIPEEQAYDYDTVSAEVESPHWAFGRPLARTMEIAVLAPAMSQRETAELMQRLDCAATAIMTYTAGTFGADQSRYGVLTLENATQMAREKLQRSYDAVVIGRQRWDSIPGDLRERLLVMVRDGTGLVYVAPAGQASVAEQLGLQQGVDVPPDLLAGVPVASLPAFETVAPDVRAWTLGEGRVLTLDYGQANGPSGHHYLTPPTRRHQGGFRHYDYYQSLLAKAVRWAAGSAGPRIASLEATPEVARGASVALAARLSQALPDGVTATCRLRRMSTPHLDGAERTVDVAAGATEFAATLPAAVPAGRYCYDVTLRHGREVLDWASAAVEVTAPVTIAGVDLSGDFVTGDDRTLSGSVRLSSEPSEGERAIIEVRDTYDRLVARSELEVAGTTAEFAVDVSGSRSAFNQVTVLLQDGDGTASVLTRDFTVRQQHDMRDFHFIAWGSGGDDYIAALLRREMAASGVDACDMGVGGWDPDPLTEERRATIERNLSEVSRTGISPLPYICRIWPARNEAEDTVRDPCLTDPAYRAALHSALIERAEICRRFSPLGYTLGDENYLGTNNQFCTSETCLAAFAGYLRRQYRDMRALRQAWDEPLASPDDATPLLRSDVEGPAQYPRWVQWRLSMNEIFADAHRLGREAIRSVDADARVGFDGAYGDSTTIGYDWHRLGQICDTLNVYFNSTQVEMVRSFTRPEALTGCWFGGYTYHRLRPDFERWAPWAQLFAGCNSSWFYSPYTVVGGAGELGFRPDLRPYDCWSICSREVARISDGIGKLLLTADRDNCGIAVVYSTASQMVSDLDGRYDEHLRSLGAFCAALEDAGFQYRLVHERQLAEDGALTGYGAAILPTCVALPDEALPALESLLRRGGVVLADWGAGLYDANGVRREQGLLDRHFGIERDTEGIVRATMFGIPEILPMASIDAAVRAVGGEAETQVEDVPVIIRNRSLGGTCCYLNFSLRTYTKLRAAAGAGLRSLLRETLRGEGIAEPVRLDGQWGLPERVESVRWTLGDQTFIGLLKAPSTPADGEDLTLSLPPGEVYDVLRGRHLGRLQEVDVHLGPGEVALFGVLPEPLERLDVAQVEATEAAISISAVGSEATRVTHVEVTDPSGSIYPAATANLAAPRGFARYTLPLGLEAPRGSWTVTVTDVATGVSTTASVEY